MAIYDDKIGIIGLGKLGLPMLSAFIKRGFNPLGYDINNELIATLKKKSNPYQEPGINEIIESDNSWSQRFYNDLNTFLDELNVVFLIVPTPTKDVIFDISYLDHVLQNISNYLQQSKDKFLNVVITSTVNPGDCDNFITKYTNVNFSLIYSPEFIALGSVLNDMLHPDVVLLGGNSVKSVDEIFSIYNRLYESHPEYHRLSYFEAETAKIGINTFITTKISFANTIGMFIEKKTGSRHSSQRTLNAIGGDSRVGRKYFKYGVSYGGPCFPRDNRALAYHLQNNKINASLPNSTDIVNDSIIPYWQNIIKFNKYDAVVMVGVAYKAGTNFLEESFMIKLSNKLTIPVFYFDRLVNDLSGLIKITELNHVEKLKKFNNIVVLKNYDNFIFDNKLNNLHIIELWN